MKATLLAIAILTIGFLASCKKHHDQQIPVITYDADALKFFDSSAIADTAQMSAINSFIKQLKDSSLWTKFTAIYPMVGGTANSTKWNLKNPANSDAAYRLTFSGTPTFSNTGVLFTTVSDFADTHVYDSTLTYNNNAISYFSRTENTTDGYDMGCADYIDPYNEFAIYQSSDATNWFGFSEFGRTPVSTKGLFMLSSTTTDVKRYENGEMVLAKGAAPVNAFTAMPILIGNVAGSAAGGQRECSLASIGQGLSDAEAKTFYNIVNQLETRLNR